MNASGDLIHAYRAHETGDRDIVEKVLTDDFTFTNPLSDPIDRAKGRAEGRAAAFGLQAGGPALRFHDEYGNAG
jgi:hypothetical protein